MLTMVIIIIITVFDNIILFLISTKLFFLRQLITVTYNKKHKKLYNDIMITLKEI